MSEYPYEGKIHGDDKVNYSTVYSSDGIRIGKVSWKLHCKIFHCKERNGKQRS